MTLWQWWRYNRALRRVDDAVHYAWYLERENANAPYRVQDAIACLKVACDAAGVSVPAGYESADAALHPKFS